MRRPATRSSHPPPSTELLAKPTRLPPLAVPLAEWGLTAGTLPPASTGPS
ncbi:hypothetical protein [Actinomadura alba]|uniref:Uncharacterized protein n=1 Tax=Actinomadura alba TaxID=406431 RepID=A0ABR7M095_9ACTN|nr:hypothetical protein [Actinomadura alba]MBC6470430.1 hypothetical protein [Actinomadura alba]